MRGGLNGKKERPILVWTDYLVSGYGSVLFGAAIYFRPGAG